MPRTAASYFLKDDTVVQASKSRFFNPIIHFVSMFEHAKNLAAKTEHFGHER